MTFFSQPILKALEIIKESGFDYAEIWADHAWDEDKGASAEELKAALERLDLRSTVHCPIFDIKIASPNRGIRAESLRQTFNAVDLARDLGSRLFVLHPGSKFSVLDDPQTHWRFQVDSLAKILAYAKAQGVLAAVENMDSDKEVVSVKYWADLNRLFKDLGSSEKWVTLDITHLRDTEQVLTFIEQAGPNIAHVHLSDGTLQKMHLPIGAGDLDLPRIAAALGAQGYAGVWSLECFIAENNLERIRAELDSAKALFQVR